MNNKYFKLNNYIPCRYDRDTESPKKHEGGGVN